MDWSHLRRVRSGKNWGICEEDWLGYLDTVIPSYPHREAQALPSSNSLGKGNYFVLKDTALPYVWTPEEAAADAKPWIWSHCPYFPRNLTCASSS